MTPIDAKKDAMGYKTITMRPRCGACTDVSSSPLDLRLTCDRGGFIVTSISVCDQYRPRGANAPARQAGEGAAS